MSLFIHVARCVYPQHDKQRSVQSIVLILFERLNTAADLYLGTEAQNFHLKINIWSSGIVLHTFPPSKILYMQNMLENPKLLLLSINPRGGPNKSTVLGVNGNGTLPVPYTGLYM